jgi:hypothetical protein
MTGDGVVGTLHDLFAFNLAQNNPTQYEGTFRGLDYRARGDTNHDGVFNGDDHFVPEPGTGVLAVIGIAVIGLLRRRKSQFQL